MQILRLRAIFLLSSAILMIGIETMELVRIISELDSSHMNANSYKLQQGKPQQILGKILGSPRSQSNTGRGCPVKLSDPHL